MNTLHFLAVAISSLFAYQASECVAQNQQPNMKQIIVEKIALFKTKGTSGDLQEAYAKVDSVADLDEDARGLLRLNVVEAAMSRLDSTCDVDHPPQMFMNLTPPQGADGHIYDSGIAPEAVKDPKDRAEYIKRINDNATKIAKHNEQVAIRKVWDSFTQRLEFAKKNAANDPVFLKSAEQLKKALPTSTLDAAAKQRLTEILQPVNSKVENK